MGKGNQWWVSQRGAGSVGYGSRRAAWRAAASLRNARVAHRYGKPSERSGEHSVSDVPARTPAGALAALGHLAAVAVIRAARAVRRRLRR